MGKKSRLSRDQKRKAKLAREGRRSHQRQSLAYTGNKYKTDELVPVFFRTEVGIYESYVMTERDLTDHDVEAGLEKLIGQMRQGPLPPLSETGKIDTGEVSTEDLIIWNIRRNWQDLFKTQPRPPVEQLIGVLRTTLATIERWSSPSADARGYLSFLKGFLKKAGVSVDTMSADMEVLPEPPEEELAAIGRAWCRADDTQAADEFRAMAEKMLLGGQAELVVEICQELMGETDDNEIIGKLGVLANLAQQRMPKRLN